jgi:hypothetical protein
MTQSPMNYLNSIDLSRSPMSGSLAARTPMFHRSKDSLDIYFLPNTKAHIGPEEPGTYHHGPRPAHLPACGGSCRLELHSF